MAENACWMAGLFSGNFRKSTNFVIPAEAGIQVLQATDIEQNLGSRLRGNDGGLTTVVLNL